MMRRAPRHRSVGCGLLALVAQQTLGCGAPPSAPGAPPFVVPDRVVSAGRARPRLIRPAIPPPTFGDDERSARARAAFDELVATAEDHRRERAIPAMVLGVVLDDQIVAQRAWGTMGAGKGDVDGKTIFRIGSLSKIVTAMAALRLVSEGKLDLDAPAQRHLPELAGLRYPTLDAGVITPRQLLTHTSGLPREIDALGAPDHASETELLERLDGLALRHPPGTTVSYSDLGMGLLGVLVARASGMPLRDYVARHVARPLAMTDMAWDAGDVSLDRLADGQRADGAKLATAQHHRLGPLEGSGGLYASLADLAKLASAQLGAWPPRNDPDRGPVPRALLRASQRLQAYEDFLLRAARNPRSRAVVRGTGLAWQVEQTCRLDHVVWHNGKMDGHEAALVLLPRRGLGLILLARTSNGALTALAHRLVAQLVEDARLPRRHPSPSPAMDDAARAVARMLQLGNVNEPTYNEIFSSMLRRELALSDVRQQLETHRQRYGPCNYDGYADVESPLRGRVRLKCDRGNSLITLEVAAPPGTTIEEIHLGASSESSPHPRCPP